MNKEKIFISHSSKDIKVIEAFVENILRLGLDISSNRIFCTSIEGHGIEGGQYIPDKLREEIHNASIALLFISKNYRSSEVCLNELGAAWVTLEKQNVIPLLLPDTEFNSIGFLDLGRVALKVYEQVGILKLIQEQKEKLNPSFHLEKLHIQIDKFLNKIKPLYQGDSPKDVNPPSAEATEWKECFEDNLYPFNDILRQAVPTLNDGIFEIRDLQTQNKILDRLSKTNFLRTLWYKKAEGDFYVESIKKLPSGNWLISEFGWEIKLSSMWISKHSEYQYEFILIRSELQDPYKIDSDIGGESFNVGVLNDGTIVSENERLNGYAIINGETIDLSKYGIEPRLRDRESHWVFLVTDYHKAGYNADETFAFCRALDNGLITVTPENIYMFLRRLRNNPTVIKWR